MDIEKTMNDDQLGNANNQQGSAKNVNNTKSVVANQVQHLIKVAMVFGTLNKALLNKGHICESPLFQEDAAPGSVLIRPGAAPGSVQSAAAAAELSLYSQELHGGIPLVRVAPNTEPPRDAVLPARVSRPRSPGTQHAGESPLVATTVAHHHAVDPTARESAALQNPTHGDTPLGAATMHGALRSPLSKVAPAATAVGLDRPRGVQVLEVAPTCAVPKPVVAAATPVAASPYAPALRPDAQSTGVQDQALGDLHGELQVGSSVATSPGSSAHRLSTNYGVAYGKKKTGSQTDTTVHLDGTAKHNSLVNKVVAFGGIAAPSLSVRASDRIRAQPNADATQMERAMQNVTLRYDLPSPGYSHYGALDPAMALLTPGGPARVHGFWMQPPSNDCQGYFLPGYLAAC
jgi:hypothetical protein